jgi:hypothetical protein
VAAAGVTASVALRTFKRTQMSKHPWACKLKGKAAAARQAVALVGAVASRHFVTNCDWQSTAKGD